MGFGVVAGGLALRMSAKHMPARTPKGSAVLARVLGFRQYIRTAEVDQLKFEERESIFSRYLPYAIVFGDTDRWAKAFASLAADPSTGGAGGAGGLYWYSGPGSWDLGHFGSSMNSFTTACGVLFAAGYDVWRERRSFVVGAIVGAGLLAASTFAGEGASSLTGQRKLVVFFSSMEPTLHCARPGPGCRGVHPDVVVWDAASGQTIRRGQIVVFRWPPPALPKCGFPASPGSRRCRVGRRSRGSPAVWRRTSQSRRP